MPFDKIRGNVRLPVVPTNTPPADAPGVPGANVNLPKLEGNQLRELKPRTADGSVFEPKARTVKRTGTDDDSLGAGSLFKGSGVYDEVVNAGLVGRDLDPDRLALRDAIWERLEAPSYLLEPASTNRSVDAKRLSAALKEAAPGRQGEALARLSQSKPEVAARLDGLLTSTNRLPADVRSSLLQTFAQSAAGVGGAVTSAIARSAAFQALSGAQQGQLAKVVARLDEKGLKVLGSLVERAPEALTDLDSRGDTLLSHLSTLASQPLNASLVGHTSTEDLLSSALVDVMNPNRIDQGSAPTCTVTSMQFELVADEPAEYLRLLAGVTGPKGSVQMKGGGDLRLGPGDADPRARGGRSVSQAIFQSAAMEYANGRFSNFDPVIGLSTNTRTGATQQGLKPDNQQALLENLFGVKYSIDRLYSESEGEKALAKLVGWDARGARNRPIVVDLDQGPFNHTVTLEAVTREKVLFRDPYGVLRSMPASTFPKVAVAIHLPSDVKVSGVR